MKQSGYLQWAVENTKTVWWHDSAEPREIERGIQRGAIGATTNPFLSHLALSLNKDAWAKEMGRVLSEQMEPERKAEQLMSIAIKHAAKQFESQHEKRYRTLLENVKENKVFQRQQPKKWKCLNCGYIFEGTAPPQQCPACKHPQAYFEILAENY